MLQLKELVYCIQWPDFIRALWKSPQRATGCS